jgi:hypothetical protein
MNPAIDLYRTYDDNRPWGGFLLLMKVRHSNLPYHYFEGLDVASLKISGN